MQRNLSADWIFPVSSAPIANGVLRVTRDGEILAIHTAEQAATHKIEHIERYEGVLVPGFINTHCHLELSHLYGAIPEKTGLPAFVRSIVTQRAAIDEVVIAAMEKADREMYENGIVAVGDIANHAISADIKQRSPIYYHTFVEVFGFNESPETVIENAVKVKAQFSPLNASIVPHAPYSVSKELFELIRTATAPDDIVSIHNQETLAENEFFKTGTGHFEQMYVRLNMPKAVYHGAGKNALEYHLPQLPRNNLLLVHNTFTSKADIDFATQQHQALYWCFCPRANIYIEGNLPDVAVFLNSDVKITLGTDSLASNHQLSMLAEMQVLQQQKQVPFDKLLKWATLNGASFLNIDQQYGSFDVGKKPGVNLISLSEDQIIEVTTVNRLI